MTLIEHHLIYLLRLGYDLPVLLDPGLQFRLRKDRELSRNSIYQKTNYWRVRHLHAFSDACQLSEFLEVLLYVVLSAIMVVCFFTTALCSLSRLCLYNIKPPHLPLRFFHVPKVLQMRKYSKKFTI